MSSFLSQLDAFGYIPEGSFLKDEFRLNRSIRGGCFTIVAWITMALLFFCELQSYLTPTLKTIIAMDDNASDTIEVYFDITMDDLPCRFTSVDLVDDFGEETRNVTSNIVKINKHWHKGKLLEGSVHEDKDMLHEEEYDDYDDEVEEVVDRFAEVDEEGHHALHIPGDRFDHILKYHHLTFVNFYAPWCSWCKKLEPVWEDAAEDFDHKEFTHKKLNIKFAAMDCEANSELCAKYKVRAYPSLLVFKGTEPVYPFYDGHRTADDLENFFAKSVEEYETHMPNVYKHEACQVVGWLTVARVPGNFHIQAWSEHHDMAPTMANLSHTVNHLSFGLSIPPSVKSNLAAKQQLLTNPLDGKSFGCELHSAPTHFLKVVTVFLDGYPDFPFYEMTSQNRITNYEENEIPEARFVFDFSPLAITIRRITVHWYEFLTSLLALIGGAYTIIQLINNFFGTLGDVVQKGMSKTK